ncbi:MAG: hypothetical protein ACOCQW_02200 [Halanaerobiaceae bacterium]
MPGKSLIMNIIKQINLLKQETGHILMMPMVILSKMDMVATLLNTNITMRTDWSKQVT